MCPAFNQNIPAGTSREGVKNGEGQNVKCRDTKNMNRFVFI